MVERFSGRRLADMARHVAEGGRRRLRMPLGRAESAGSVAGLRYEPRIEESSPAPASSASCAARAGSWSDGLGPIVAVQFTCARLMRIGVSGTNTFCVPFATSTKPDALQVANPVRKLPETAVTSAVNR